MQKNRLPGILEGLSFREFVEAAQKMHTQDAPAWVRKVFDAEGGKRAQVLADGGAHLPACLLAGAACLPATVLEFVQAGLAAHTDPEDPVRVLVIQELGDIDMEDVEPLDE